MASRVLKIYEGSFGEPLTINLLAPDNTAILSTPYDITKTTLEIKTDADVLISTITDTNMIFAGASTIDWTPTSAQVDALTKDILYNVFVHLRDTGSTLDRILTYNLIVLNS